ncbi:DUF6252 family protein [Flavobacterium psychraquaticum]|uniref:DUF6252 family protein n=1 Tax=Flavobacterium psychraquaticum TaxID=3103958 RepID=UPI002ACECB76|nr:DUF6252 family protein [Flavobacterium sp. LB-N7T]
MKKIFSLIAVAMLFTACEQNIQTNTPAFQAKLNDTQWKAKDAKVTIDANGGMSITAFGFYETLILKTSASDVGTYILGTENFLGNNASYAYTKVGSESFYSTDVVPGPVFKLSPLISGGTAYVANPSGAQTIGGSGTGLRVVTEVVAGVVKKITVVARGEGYVAGDLITIVGGNQNAKFKVVNVQQSNGEITIEEVQNGLYTGKFKLNVVNDEGDVVTFSEGVFYKIGAQ